MNHYDTYVRISALYRQHLFQTAAHFFNANTEVERAIAFPEILSKALLREVASEFSLCGAWAEEAKRSCAEFTRLHNAYPGQTLTIDAAHQLDRLAKIGSDVHELMPLIQTLVADSDLQEQIWASSEYTRLFTDLASNISAAIDWQRTLALDTHSDS